MKVQERGEGELASVIYTRVQSDYYSLSHHTLEESAGTWELLFGCGSRRLFIRFGSGRRSSLMV